MPHQWPLSHLWRSFNWSNLSQHFQSNNCQPNNIFASHKYTCQLSTQNDFIFCTYACPVHWCVCIYVYKMQSALPVHYFPRANFWIYKNITFWSWFKVKYLFFSALLNFKISEITSHSSFPFFPSNSAMLLLTPSQIRVLFYHVCVYALHTYLVFCYKLTYTHKLQSPSNPDYIISGLRS